MAGGILGAKAIAQLKADHKKLSRLRPTLGESPGKYLNTPNGSLVVKLEEAIGAGDYGFHPAKIMKLEDGSWVEADCPSVQVRAPLDLSFAVGSRQIATLVSNLGLCIGLGSNFAWGELSQPSGRDDSLLDVTLYESAMPAEFVSSTCGGGSGSGSGSDGAFLDMDFTLCTPGDTVLALVPAGYKAGPVGLAQWPDCNPGSGSGAGSGSGSTGSGSSQEWNGWVVVFGRRLRCQVEIPKKWECCPTEGLKATEFKNFWFFGEVQDDRLDPCATGSGSGS